MSASETVKSNTIRITVKENLWGKLERNSEEWKIFIYDVYERLYKNLNRLKQLQLFSIQQFFEDTYKNQWFLFKPKYQSISKTDDSEIIYSDSEIPENNDTATDDSSGTIGNINYLNVSDIKTGLKNSSFRNIGGELWVRLHNFPFAYPVQFNTTSNSSEWDDLSNESTVIYKCGVYNDFGYIYYDKNGTKYVIFFRIENYNTIEYVMNKDILDDIVKYEEKDGVLSDKELEKVVTTKKTIKVSLIKKIEFNSAQKQEFIDCISYNSRFYLFFADSDTQNNNIIYLTKIDNEENLQYNSQLVADTTINLPEHTFNIGNICSPANIANWTTSISNDNINLAYQANPYEV